MLIDTSFFFNQIKPNQYVFRVSPVIFSSGYVVTYKEKLQLESLIEMLQLYGMKAGAICAPLTIAYWPLGLIVSVLATIYSFLMYHKELKLIVKNREKVHIKRESILYAFERQYEVYGLSQY